METQKIIEQRLDGSEESAKAEAQYTWEEDEIAWKYCNIYRDVFKVKFTGKRWIIGNKWRRNKIYQFEYLDSSGRDLEYAGDNGDKISHSNEDEFYITRGAAIERAKENIGRVKDSAVKTYEEDIAKIEKYESEQD